MSLNYKHESVLVFEKIKIFYFCDPKLMDRLYICFFQNFEKIYITSALSSVKKYLKLDFLSQFEVNGKIRQDIPSRPTFMAKDLLL